MRGVRPFSEEVTNDWRFAGETPALFAEQSAFGDCQAAAQLVVAEKNGDNLRIYAVNIWWFLCKSLTLRYEKGAWT